MNEDREYGRAEGKAFRLLTLRAHSKKELRAKLREGGFPAPVIEQVVRRCRELGYLNDEAFARQRARVLAVSRLAGDRRIALDLRERGIDAGLSARVIAEVRGELGEEEAAKRLLRKKIRGRPVAALTEREKAGLARSLMGKGFPTGLILRILKKTEEEGFHDDDGE
ncbi:MAG: RecX family transcriptional regulator [Proteobacteria bacterium]|nr:RecX family transcriptional regulator [Pseudomonadota bacterium]MBU1745593.1 RecX family transcriptional regulator [Pseudomonadota bacterium]MBU1965453.1 RecX family transcriptional regulator [Pseudomonadota bacterium]